jgi:hypothetical protein
MSKVRRPAASRLASRMHRPWFLRNTVGADPERKDERADVLWVK